MIIKVCGMRNSKNIKELVKLAPNYVGFIFYEKSKRFVAYFPEVTIPNTIKKVGVFVNETLEEITKKITQYNLQVVQLHGNETPQFCMELKSKFLHSSKLQIIKAFAVDANFDFGKTNAYKNSCDLFLFDTKGKEYGGNGIKYDWNILQKYNGETPYLLSGGITENDTEKIISFLQKQESRTCVGVDLNSGFENAPAIKNIEKLKQFMSFLRRQESHE